MHDIVYTIETCGIPISPKGKGGTIETTIPCMPYRDLLTQPMFLDPRGARLPLRSSGSRGAKPL